MNLSIASLERGEQRRELKSKFPGSFQWRRCSASGQFIPCHLSLVPEVFAIVNSIQSPSRFVSGEFLCGRTLVCKLKTLLLFYIFVDFH